MPTLNIIYVCSASFELLHAAGGTLPTSYITNIMHNDAVKN